MISATSRSNIWHFCFFFFSVRQNRESGRAYDFAMDLSLLDFEGTLSDHLLLHFTSCPNRTGIGEMQNCTRPFFRSSSHALWKQLIPSQTDSHNFLPRKRIADRSTRETNEETKKCSTPTDRLTGRHTPLPSSPTDISSDSTSALPRLQYRPTFVPRPTWATRREKAVRTHVVLYSSPTANSGSKRRLERARSGSPFPLELGERAFVLQKAVRVGKGRSASEDRAREGGQGKGKVTLGFFFVLLSTARRPSTYFCQERFFLLLPDSTRYPLLGRDGRRRGHK